MWYSAWIFLSDRQFSNWAQANVLDCSVLSDCVNFCQTASTVVPLSPLLSNCVHFWLTMYTFIRPRQFSNGAESYVLDCPLGRRPVLPASRKAACKPLPDNEIVPKTNIKSNICQLLHHGILPDLHLFHRQTSSAQLAVRWQRKSFRGWFCVENRQNILRQDSPPPPHPSSFSSSSSTCSARGAIS